MASLKGIFSKVSEIAGGIGNSILENPNARKVVDSATDILSTASNKADEIASSSKIFQRGFDLSTAKGYERAQKYAANIGDLYRSGRMSAEQMDRVSARILSNPDLISSIENSENARSLYDIVNNSIKNKTVDYQYAAGYQFAKNADIPGAQGIGFTSNINGGVMGEMKPVYTLPGMLKDGTTFTATDLSREVSWAERQWNSKGHGFFGDELGWNGSWDELTGAQRNALNQKADQAFLGYKQGLFGENNGATLHASGASLDGDELFDAHRASGHKAWNRKSLENSAFGTENFSDAMEDIAEWSKGNAGRGNAFNAYKEYRDAAIKSGEVNAYNIKSPQDFIRDHMHSAGYGDTEIGDIPNMKKKTVGQSPNEKKNKGIASRIAKHPVLATAGVMGTIWGISELKDEDWS